MTFQSKINLFEIVFPLANNSLAYNQLDSKIADGNLCL